MTPFEQHEMVETPGWDTKTTCVCGERFSNRMEFYRHRGDAYKEQLDGAARA